MANPMQDVQVPSSDVARALVLEKEEIIELRGEIEEEKFDGEEDSGDEEESKEVKGNEEEVDGKEVNKKKVQKEGRNDEWLDFGSVLGEGSPPTLCTQSRSPIQSQAQVVDYVDNGSDKVFFSLTPILSPLYFFAFKFFGIILVVSSFVASYTNDVD